MKIGMLTCYEKQDAETLIAKCDKSQYKIYRNYL